MSYIIHMIYLGKEGFHMSISAEMVAALQKMVCAADLSTPAVIACSHALHHYAGTLPGWQVRTELQELIDAVDDLHAKVEPLRKFLKQDGVDCEGNP